MVERRGLESHDGVMYQERKRDEKCICWQLTRKHYRGDLRTAFETHGAVEKVVIVTDGDSGVHEVCVRGNDQCQ